MTTKEFVGLMRIDNSALLDKINVCKTPEEVWKVAKAEGLTDDLSTFTAEMTKIHNSVKDLKEEDLANVSGGLDDTVYVSIGSATAAAVSAVVSVSVGTALTFAV